MTKLLVDPFLLAVPEDVSPKLLESFVSGLTAWGEAVDEGTVVLMSRNCRSRVEEGDLFPNTERIRRLFDQHRISTSTWYDTAQQAQLLYDRLGHLEDHVCCAVQCDDRGVAVDPATVHTRLPAEVAEALVGNLAEIAFWQAHLKAEDDQLIFAAAPGIELPDKENLCITTTITEYDAADHRPCDCPVALEELLAVRFGYEEIWKGLALAKIWGQATSETDLRRAIQLRMQQYIDQGRAKESEKVEFVFGDHFLKTIQEERITVSRSGDVDTLLRVIASLLVGHPIKREDDFREDEDSEDQLVREDGAQACRMHVTEKKAGYRLMYWRRTDKKIELAAVRTKQDVKM